MCHQPIQFHRVCQIQSAGPRSSTYPAGRQPIEIFARPVISARKTASEFSTGTSAERYAHPRPPAPQDLPQKQHCARCAADNYQV